MLQGLVFASLAAFVASSPARAFEFLEGRLQVHGFYEAQIRSISRDFDEDWDLTQWYNILNIEVEADIAPDGFGPFDMVSAYARVEARYDCVWTHACSMFDSANAFGSRSRFGRLPQRLLDGRRSGYTATALNKKSGFADKRHYNDVPWFGPVLLDVNGDGEEEVVFDCNTLPTQAAVVDCLDLRQSTVLNAPSGSRQPIRWWQQFAYTRQAGQSPGADQVFDLAGGALCPVGFDRGILCGRMVRFDDDRPLDRVASLLEKPTFTDDPAANVMRSVRDCFYGDQKTGGPTNGQGNRALLLSIDGCKVREIGVLREIPNPFRGAFDLYGNPRPNADGTRGDVNPWLGRARNANGQFIDASGNVVPFEDARPLSGSTELPFRPAPGLSNRQAGDFTQGQGIYYPPRELANAIRDDDFESLPTFTEKDLAWNRGASQDQTKELKELYVDLEFFDSRLWVRAGKQQIVWGKTELFRTTDQFNPQDLALTSLPSLEESRIALWALRGVWSFYDVGPLQDLRVELAMNYDEFQPSDLGRCGEPYVIDLVCGGTFGLQTHGILGLGLAGVVLPEDPWDSGSGIEAGARVEWRYGRFSFAITDFWGYGDFPTVDQITAFSRNVDPNTGRPRKGRSQGPCTTGDSTIEPACLGVAFLPPPPIPNPENRFTPFPTGLDPNGNPYPNVPQDVDGDGQPDTLTDHHANQQIFAWICGTTIGVTTLDPTACGNTIFNSYQNLFTSQPATNPLNQPTLSSFASGLIAANTGALGFAMAPQGFDVDLPAIRLNQDVGDTRPSTGFFGLNPSFDTLNKVLSAEQQALLGCGAYYATDCDVQGFDLLNAEASALFQSFAGFEGTASPATNYTWNLSDGTVPQPGTVYFEGGPVCTRSAGAGTVQLPGCRGPGDPGYNPAQDGTTTVAGGGQHDLIVPYFDPSSRFFMGTDGATPCQTPSATFNGCQRFKSEAAALSWNLQMLLVGFSSSNVVDANEDQLLDPNDPFRIGGCSFYDAVLCIGVSGFLDFTRVQRATVRAGGNADFGRRDFVWQMGTPLKVRFEKRNVLGFSMDWAEDVTKSNWSIETTWIEGVPVFDSDSLEGTTDVDNYNFTVSVDRPTFVNFLNSNRTFFINSQWFLQYVDGYTRNMPGAGPWNLLGTLTATTGYFQDRLLPAITFVHDVRSTSGAVLPSIAYRFTENFSATFGIAAFYGRQEYSTTAVTQIGAANRVHKHKDDDAVLRGLSVIRDRDEVFLRVKYTF
jgi:hypothetical protein